MEIVPPPVKSPSPPDPGPEEPSKVTKLSTQTELLRNLFLGGCALLFGVGGGIAWKVFDKFDVVNTATAQTKATADTALEASKQNAARLENIDGGMRLAVERLERKIDANNEEMARKMDRLLAEVKKR